MRAEQLRAIAAGVGLSVLAGVLLVGVPVGVMLGAYHLFWAP
jgi:hypothetical protein